MDATPYHFLPGRGPADLVAVRDGERITAGTLIERAATLAENLADADATTCLCRDRVNIATALLAALLRGIPCVMPHDQTADRLAWIRRQYPRAVPLTESGLAADLQALDVDRLQAGKPATATLDAISFPGDRCAVHVFTSGSTSEPRIHRKSWASLARVARSLGERFALEPDAHFIATVPGQHVYGLEASVLLPLQNRGIIHAGKPLLPADVQQSLAQTTPPSVLVSTPFHLRQLVASELSLPSPTRVISATAPLPTWLARSVEESCSTRVVEMYGSTETGVVGTRAPTMDTDWQIMESVELRFEEDRTLVIAPYLPEAMPLNDRLGDCGHRRFRLHGRETDMVKIAGRRCSLSEIGEKIGNVPGIEDAALYLPEDEAGSARRIVAFVRAPSLTPAGIRAALKQTLDPAFLPRPIIKVEAIPRAETGKVRRSDLDKLYEDWRNGVCPC